MKNRMRFYSKKSLFLLVIIISIIMFINKTQTVKAEVGEEKISGFWKYEINKDKSGITITGYTGWDSDLAVPSTIDGYKVTILGNAFRENSKIVNVTLPDSITMIYGLAFNDCSSLKSVKLGSKLQILNGFQGCTSLESITIPASVNEISSYTFNGCESLKTVNFDSKSKLQSIRDFAFVGCINLENIKIPDSVTTLGISSFENCEKLASVKLSKNIKTIESRAFKKCLALAGINLPKGLETIGYEAFYNCTSLKSVVVPETVTELGKDLFANCTSLESAVIPGSCKYLPVRIFSECYGLKNVTLGEGLLWIGEGSFYNCLSLRELVIPNTVVAIYSRTRASFSEGWENRLTFWGTSNLKLTIPNSVTFIGESKKDNLGIIFTNYMQSKNSMNAAIYGYKNSIAEEYANLYNIPFVELEAICATSIEIKGSKNTIGIGEELALSYKVTPANTTDAVSWLSSAEKVAKVNEQGIITGTGLGSAVIRGVTTSGVYMDFTVTVGEEPTSVTIKNSSVTLGVGEDFSQKGKVNDKAVTKTLTYTSSDPSVATVNSDGKVTAKKVGTAEIIIATYNGRTTTYLITVKKAPTSVKVTSSVKTVKVNNKVQIKTTLSANSASNKLIYSTSNKDIATVSSTGVVTAKKVGEVKITVSTYNGLKATYILKIAK